MALTAAISLGAAPSYAGSLVTRDLNSPGDKLLTIDTGTGLAFLDPAATSGLTYNQIASSGFVVNQGFQFATTSQLRRFLTDGGITNFSGNFNTTDAAAVKNLLTNDIGETITAPITLPPAGMKSISDGVYGFTDDPTVAAGTFNVAGLDFQSAALGQAPQDQARTILNLIAFPGDALPPNPGGNGINGSGSERDRPISRPKPPTLSGLPFTSYLAIRPFFRGAAGRHEAADQTACSRATTLLSVSAK